MTNLTITEDPSAEPVSVSELKAYLRVDHDDADDLIETLGIAAREYVETALGKQLVTAKYRLELAGFPAEGGSINLPRPPLQSIEDVSYVDRDGSTVPLDTTDFHISGIGNMLGLQPKIMPAEHWPRDTADRPDCVSINYTCGYGDPADVPSRVRLCVKALAAHWFENREPAVIGTGASSVPFHVDRLINSTKAWLAV